MTGRETPAERRWRKRMERASGQTRIKERIAGRWKNRVMGKQRRRR